MTEHEETPPEAAEEARATEPPVEAESPETAREPEAAAPEAAAQAEPAPSEAEPEQRREPEAPAPEPEAEEARPTDPPAEAEAPPQAEPPPIDTEMPRVGPKIVGMAEEKPPPIAVIKRLQDPRRPRRKRPNAAEKHRRAFFARLNELRGSRPAPPKQEAPKAEEAAPAEEPQAEAAETEAVEPEAVEAPMPVEAGSVAEETPAAEEQPAPAAEEQPAAEAEEQPAPAAEEQPAAEAEEPISEETPARRQARLAAAIERVGGPEIVRQALQPKRDDEGQPKKWAVVCCDASLGLKPGDPTFNAWVRLAATPVREIKGLVRSDDGERRGGRRGGPGHGRGGQRREGGQAGGGRGGGRREGGDRGPRRERVSREDLQGAQDGSFKPTIRIIGLDDQDEDRKERERRRKEEREAKRKAERERLERLGY